MKKKKLTPALEELLNFKFMDFYDQKDHKIKEIPGFEKRLKQALLSQRQEFKKEKKKFYIDAYKKGYFKGVLDSEYGQVTSEELLDDMAPEIKVPAVMQVLDDTIHGSENTSSPTEVVKEI